MRVLALGPLWRGSNAGGLFRAMSRQGCILEVIDEFYFLSLQSKVFTTRVVERLLRTRQMAEYNDAVKRKITLFRPEFLFVYKGAFVLPETLHFARQRGCRLVLFYPDVSMTAHGGNIPQCIPLYDLIFTTKTFGIQDIRQLYGRENVRFIPHGFDPEIHRKLEIDNADRKHFGCDASFIGTWSPKKEAWLQTLKTRLPDIDLKIWGEQWNKSASPGIRECIQHTAVLGDLYAIAIQCSRINLAILSEQRVGSSSGDLITSRTFHIPGASGFMLHERNEESIQYFIENEEAGFFADAEEMAERVQYFLQQDDLREKIRQAGYERAQREYSLDVRALEVMTGMMETG